VCAAAQNLLEDELQDLALVEACGAQVRTAWL
jgi:hypothetical protein